MFNLSGFQKGLVLIILFLIFVFGFSLNKLSEKEVFIPNGSSFSKICRILKDEGISGAFSMFKFWVKVNRAERKLKPGLYVFKENTSGYRIFKKLYKGESVKVKVTIPEGFRTEQIAKRLERLGLVEKEKFMEVVRKNNYDGKLFPETYFFTPGISEEEIARQMYLNFRRFYDKKIKERAKKIRMKENEVVILASIIEKEARTKDEKFLISGIFHNRLKKRWRLESCATVRFALKKWIAPLTFKDLKAKSPYNTYRHFGLPPGPICNPGKISLLAAVEPKETDLFFFVSDGKGTHRFSRYFKEHVRKKFEEKRRR